MADQNSKKITVCAGSTELRFSVDLMAFHAFQNDFLPNNKVAPSNNFLMRTIHPDDKESLNALLDMGQAINLAQAVAGEFTGDVEITVKK
ncbi:putative phage tail assembly chaperone [Oceanobacter sp. 4_MG-2023]|uniref:putative phage tail assembly chaperone n=1 Tax=Oceanobacter sp. 4_MG-2023 TaxID=3062623 RepID=UPI0027338A44|nr:putative phage tail assembly chaperone [Oceanobacter sp. 4_MG-2023]MDP2548900.1 putative phage tail assembly chaperone [Oceanobacter sp. 4_MG-2023]